jgi:signal transduction histidine kinase
MFPVVLTVLTALMMVGTGSRIMSEFRETRMQVQIEIAETFLTHFLEPYARTRLSSSGTSAQQREALEAALARHLGTKPMIAAQIWLPDGQLLYSSTNGLHVEDHDDSDLVEALRGQRVVQLETVEDGHEVGPIALPYLEVYMPIMDPSQSTPIAVGEIYLDAKGLIDSSGQFERTVWLSIGSAMVAMIGMLGLSARQSEVLRARLEAEQLLVSQNHALRQEAEKARYAAAEANEQTLNFIGAEIHDGPLQLLGLAALMGSTTAEPKLNGDAAAPSLVQQAVGELRRISAGLILPEIEELGPLETVKLAVSRHRSLTGTSVDLSIDGPSSLPGLDLSRRICLYRVLQEGLSNATRHGGEGPVQVSLSVEKASLVVNIVSARRPSTDVQGDDTKQKLGLQGMRRRIAAFSGTVELEPLGDQARLVVRLPFS